MCLNTAIGEIMARMSLGMNDLDLGDSGKNWRQKFSAERFLTSSINFEQDRVSEGVHHK
jgi:hypothetical protein